MHKSLIFFVILFCSSFSCYSQVATGKNFKIDFGAKGDGTSDDSEAWHRAIQYFNEEKQGKLYIPEGTYRVGRQIIDQNPSNNISYATPAFKSTLSNIDGLTIEGELKNGKLVSVFKYIDNLKYGFFDPSTGSPSADVSSESYAEAGAFLLLSWSCSNVIIKNLELDGNSTHAIYNPAPKGKRGPDLGYIGISSYGAKNVLIENIYVHHFGLDGIYIQTPRQTLSAGKYHARLNKIKSEYNGRQGLSFTVGTNLYVSNSTFQHTGMAGIRISPCANVDVENHDKTGAPLSNSVFENCIIANNQGGGGSLNIAGKVDSLLFKNCTIDAGEKTKNTNRIYAVQMNFSPSRNVTFDGCNLNGVFLMYQKGKKMDDQGFTLLTNCTITDNNFSNKIPATQPLIDVYDRIKFDNCKFFINQNRKFIRSSVYNKNSRTLTDDVILEGCTIMDLTTKKNISGIQSRITPNIKLR